MGNLASKIFVHVPQDKVANFIGKYVTGELNTSITAVTTGYVTGSKIGETLYYRSTAYDSKIVFLGTSKTLFAQGNIYGIDSDTYTTLNNTVNTLNADANTEGSVKKLIADAIASIVSNAPETFDTLKEIAAWIAGDDGVVAKTAEEIITEIGNKYVEPEYYTFEEYKESHSDVTTIEQFNALPSSVKIKTAAVSATGIYKEIDDKIAALDVEDSDIANKYVSAVSETDGKISVTRTDLPVIGVDTSSSNYVVIDDAHKIEIKTTELGTAVGLKKVEAGDLTTISEKTYLTSSLNSGALYTTPTAGLNIEAKVGDYIAADGTLAANSGLATASDVTAEIVADEKIIAAALNDYETRIAAVEGGSLDIDEVTKSDGDDNTVKVTVKTENGSVSDVDVSIGTTTAAYTAAVTGDTPVAAKLEVSEDDAAKLLTGSSVSAIKSYVDAEIAALDESTTSIATSTTDGEKSSYITITDSETTSNDHTYTLKVQEAVYAADSDKFTTEGIITSSTLTSVLDDLWETYSAE